MFLDRINIIKNTEDKAAGIKLDSEDKAKQIISDSRTAATAEKQRIIDGVKAESTKILKGAAENDAAQLEKGEILAEAALEKILSDANAKISDAADYIIKGILV